MAGQVVTRVVRTARTALADALVLLALVAGAAAPAAARSFEDGQSAADTATPAVTARVRPADNYAARLLAIGTKRSETFRGLIASLARGDVFVYVETGRFAEPGALRFVAASSNARFVRVQVRVAGRPETELVAWLGHELRHAVEIAGAPEVRNEKSELDFFKRVGFTSRATCETREAQEVWRRVLAEMR